MKVLCLVRTKDGYLRIKTRGPLRDQMAHRAFVARQIGQEKLSPTFEVHHECMNRSCWPPTNFHLVLVDQALAPYMYQTHARKGQRRRGQHVAS
jgi:hypothetical protein